MQSENSYATTSKKDEFGAQSPKEGEGEKVWEDKDEDE